VLVLHGTPISIYFGQDGLKFCRGLGASGVKAVPISASLETTIAPRVQDPFERWAPRVGTAAGDEDWVAIAVNMGETTE
jgi:hypothetical protein